MPTDPLQPMAENGQTISEAQKLVEKQAEERYGKILEHYARLKALKDQAIVFREALDVEDSFSIYTGEPYAGSNLEGKGVRNLLCEAPEGPFRQKVPDPFSLAGAEGRCFVYPCATAAYYINEPQLRAIRARSRAFVRNPYWRAIERTYVSYTVGSGHQVTVTAANKDDPSVTRDDIDACLAEIELFRVTNRYTERQKEKVRRKHRDGEYILRYFDGHPDGVLRVRWVEPLQLMNPPGKSERDGVSFGIQYEVHEDGSADYETPAGYYVQPMNFQGVAEQDELWRTMVPADEIQHRTINVDMPSPRGMPTTFFVQERLLQAVKTLKGMGQLVDVRARIGAVIQHVNAQMSDIKQMLSAEPLGAAGSASAATPVEHYPYGSIVRTSDQTKWDFPAQQIETDKIVAALAAELRAAAAATGLAEFQVSADASNANYSSTMVAEGGPVKNFEEAQAEMIEEDIEVYTKALQLAETYGRLRWGIVAKIKLSAEAPLLVSRDRLQDTQADQILAQNKVMSLETWAARNDLNAADEQELIARRAAADSGQQPAAGGDPRLAPFARAGEDIVIASSAFLREAGFNPAEPRDYRGRWTTDGGSGPAPDGTAVKNAFLNRAAMAGQGAAAIHLCSQPVAGGQPPQPGAADSPQPAGGQPKELWAFDPTRPISPEDAQKLIDQGAMKPAPMTPEDERTGGVYTRPDGTRARVNPLYVLHVGPYALVYQRVSTLTWDASGDPVEHVSFQCVHIEKNTSDFAATQGYVLGVATGKVQGKEQVLSFLTHLLPGGGAIDSARQGQKGEAVLYLASDLALALGAVAKVAAVGSRTAAVAARSAAALEAGIGVYRSGEATHLVIKGDYTGAAAAGGDAVLRLLGATAILPKGTGKAGTELEAGEKAAGGARRSEGPMASARPAGEPVAPRPVKEPPDEKLPAIERNVGASSASPSIKSEDLAGKTRTEIRDLAREKGLTPTGQPDPVDGLPRKWKDPVTGKQRLRLDRGHIDDKTGIPYNEPNAAVDHVHGYESDGVTKIRDPNTNNPHFPTPDK